MRPKRKLPIDQLPALAKNYNALARKSRTKLDEVMPRAFSLRFRNEFTRSFFAKEPWFARDLIKAWDGDIGTEWLLDRMRKRFMREGKAKSPEEVDRLIAKTMQRFLDKSEKLLATLTKQRVKLKQMEVGPTYHAMKGIFQAINTHCDKIIRFDLPKAKRN